VTILIKKKYSLLVAVVVVGIIILGAVMLFQNADQFTLVKFERDLKVRLHNAVNITNQEKKDNPEYVTDMMRVFKVSDEMIFAELVVNEPVKDYIDRKIAIITNPLIDFAGPSHLFNKGRLVVLYSGRDEKILNVLKGLLGSEITHLE
jgi:hypothetical protein